MRDDTEKFEIPENWEWHTDYECYIGEDGKAYSQEGKLLQGFADPRQRSKINRSGRPKGARDKNKLRDAQLQIDKFSVTSVDMLEKIAQNKWKELELDKPVPVTAMVKANSILLDKAISQQKEKERFQMEELEEQQKEAEKKAKEKEDAVKKEKEVNKGKVSQMVKFSSDKK